VAFIAAGARSLDRQEIGPGQRCGVPLPETAWHACPQDLPSSIAAGTPLNCCSQIRTLRSVTGKQAAERSRPRISPNLGGWAYM